MADVTTNVPCPPGLPDAGAERSGPRILHVVTGMTALGGAEAMLIRLLRRAAPTRTVVAPLTGVSAPIRDLAGPHVAFQPLGADGALGFLRTIPRLARLIRREAPDVVVCWMYHAMAAGLVATRLSGRRPAVIWNVRQALDDPSALTASTRAALRLTRALSGLPDRILFNSARAAGQHAAYGYRNTSLQVMPNGFEPVATPPAAPRAPRVFGIAGRWHPQKDQATFFRAAARLAQVFPDARFLAAGRGLIAGDAAVERAIRDAGLPRLRLTLLGEVRDMAAFYRSIDVLVLSSRTEGFPNVVAEAMAHGRPVVTTDVGDAAEIVGATGLVVPPGDPAALAGAMEAFARMEPRLYAARAEAAQRRIRDAYALEAVGARHDALYAECVRSAAAPRERPRAPGAAQEALGSQSAPEVQP